MFSLWSWQLSTTKIEAAGYAETLVTACETAHCNDPEVRNRNCLVLMIIWTHHR
jgi:hypothetical protein